MSTLDRGRYAALYGPTAGDRIRLADTNLLIEVEQDRCAGPPGRRGGLRRRQGDPRVDGPVPGHPRRGHPGHGDHRRGRARPLGRRQGRHRHPRRPDRRARQGRQPGHHGRRPPGPGDRPGHRDHRRQRQDPHRRRDRQPRTPDLPADPRHGAGQRHHHDHRRRHRPGRGHQGHHGHPERLAPGPDAGGAGPLADQRAAARQGQHHVRRSRCGSSCAAARAASSCTRTGAPRPAAIDACLRVADASGVQVAIHTDTLNEAGFVEDTLRAIGGPVHPRVPHRGRRRRARAGHHHGRRAAQRAAVVDEPDPAVHAQHPRRAPRHADGLPPPELRRCRRTWRSPRAGSGRPRWPPRTCCTTSARSR